MDNKLYNKQIGGLVPNLYNEKSRCFYHSVLQLIYRASDIRERILNNIFTDTIMNRIKQELIEMKKIDVKTKELKPSNNLRFPWNQTCPVPWMLNTNTTEINAILHIGDFGDAHIVLSKILDIINYSTITFLYLRNVKNINFFQGTNMNIFKIFDSHKNRNINFTDINDPKLKKYYYIIETNDGTIKLKKKSLANPFLTQLNKYIFDFHSGLPIHYKIYNELKIKDYDQIYKYKLIGYVKYVPGHYYTIIKNPYNENEWLKYDDLNKSTNPIKTYNLPSYENIRGIIVCYELIENKIIDIICNIINN